jgi:predicted subunit of tRNA(5-methylaminomethyl-2-thiouridylate) methyltransferase
MLLLAAAAIAVSAPDSAPRTAVAPTVQARATVRILAGTRIRFEGRRDRATPSLRAAQIRTLEGRQPAQLIEFE